MGPKFKHEIHLCFTDKTPYIYSLNVILYNIFNNVLHETEFQDVEFSICGVSLGTQKVSDFRAFWTSDFLDYGCLQCIHSQK